jgi:hypothetical protein
MDFGWEVPGWFDSGSRTGLVWLAKPEIGICREPTPAGLYGRKYWEEYNLRDRTEMGEVLTYARSSFVRLFHTGQIVDIGIGGGRFVMAWGHKAMGYDVNPFALDWLAARGIFANVTQHPFEAMTFWDSLEHMIEWGHILANCRTWAFVSTPIYLGPEECVRSKHYKPGEHVIYFTNRGLIWFMQRHGFEMVAYDNFEVKLGREAIGTYAFRRIKKGPQ